MRRTVRLCLTAACGIIAVPGGCSPPPPDAEATRRITALEERIVHMQQDQRRLEEHVQRLQQWISDADQAAAAYEAEWQAAMAEASAAEDPVDQGGEPILILEELPQIDPDQAASGVYLFELVRNDGTIAERGELALNEEGTLLRHGRLERFSRDGRRLLYQLAYENGLLADQPFIMRQDNGTPLVEGRIRESAAEGDWVWYDDNGEPAAREAFRAGQLRDLELRSPDGTWAPAADQDVENWLIVSRTYFRALPELRRPGN